MGLRKMQQNVLVAFLFDAQQLRFYSSKIDFKKLRPILLKRIENRAKDYPFESMIPLAREVLQSRMLLIQGVSTLLQAFPILACKFCSEIHIGEKGHMIRTCWGYKRIGRSSLHEWVPGGLNDIIVPVEAFKLNRMFQDVIKHNQRFDFDRTPAIVELCRQAGVDPSKETSDWSSDTSSSSYSSLMTGDLMCVGNETLKAWETLRSGVQKLSLVYPTKVCKNCGEVHVGPLGHKARLCGIFKYERWNGAHLWKGAKLNDLVPCKIVWRQRPQDPPVLLNECRDFYGHAPAVVELCSKAGALVPTKYYCMMKLNGLSAPLLAN